MSARKIIYLDVILGEIDRRIADTEDGARIEGGAAARADAMRIVMILKSFRKMVEGLSTEEIEESPSRSGEETEHVCSDFEEIESL